jgi:N-acetylmuramoyl-L-alanine amidase
MTFFRIPLSRYLARSFALAVALSATVAGAQAGGVHPRPVVKAPTSAPLSTSVKSNASLSAFRDMPSESGFKKTGASTEENPGVSAAQSQLAIDLGQVRRIKVAGVLVSDSPMRVGNLDILAPIIGDESSLLSRLGATASRVSEKNIPGNINTPTNAQSFQLNMAPRDPIVLTVGQATAYIKGQEQQLRAAPLVMNGKIYLPVFSIAPLLGAAVRLQADGTLNITPTVQSVELFPAKGYTVLMVKTSAPIPDKAVLMGTVDQPDDKVYFDFSGYAMGFDATNSTTERVVSGGLNDVRQVRAGMPQSFPDVTRVVLDLKKKVKTVLQPMPDKTMFAVLLYAPQAPKPTPIPPGPGPRPTPGLAIDIPQLSGLTIVIDPGHGGRDIGAPGARSKEKDHTLAISRLLRDELVRRGATVLMTHNGLPSYRKLELQERVNFANSRRADIFYSVHINSSTSRSSAGTETFFWTAQSQALAHETQKALAKATGLKSRGVSQRRFFVIRNTSMPSVLTETCFISNPDEESKLLNPEWRARVARGMAQGIANYVAKYGVGAGALG